MIRIGPFLHRGLALLAMAGMCAACGGDYQPRKPPPVDEVNCPDRAPGTTGRCFNI